MFVILNCLGVLTPFFTIVVVAILITEMDVYTPKYRYSHKHILKILSRNVSIIQGTVLS